MEHTQLNQIACLNQQHSPLLRLPAELRIKIWEYALGGWRICLRRPAEDPDDPSSSIQAQVYGIFSKYPDPFWRRPKHVFSLMKVCRQTYAESKLVPFSHNDFGGERTDLTHAFDTGFFNGEAGQLVSSIRILCSIRWSFGAHSYSRANLKRTLQALAKLPHLRDVVVEWTSQTEPQCEQHEKLVERYLSNATTGHGLEEKNVCLRFLDREDEGSWTHAWRTPPERFVQHFPLDCSMHMCYYP